MTRSVYWDLKDTPLADEHQCILGSFRLPLRKPPGFRTGNWISSLTAGNAPMPKEMRRKRAMLFLSGHTAKSLWPQLTLSPDVLRYLEPEAITISFAYRLAQDQTLPLRYFLQFCNLSIALLFGVFLDAGNSNSAFLIWAISLVAVVFIFQVLIGPWLFRRALQVGCRLWIQAGNSRSPAQFLCWIALYQLFRREGLNPRNPFLAWRFPAGLGRYLAAHPPEDRATIRETLEREIEAEADPQNVRSLPAYAQLMRYLGTAP